MEVSFSMRFSETSRRSKAGRRWAKFPGREASLFAEMFSSVKFGRFGTWS